MTLLAAVQPEYIDGNGFIAEVIRSSRRKSADVRVQDGTVSLVVPDDLSTHRIQMLLEQKRQWILDKIALHREAMPVQSREFISGECFPYLGRNYRLKVMRGPYEPVKLLQGRLVVTVPKGNEQPHMIRNALVRWYMHQAKLKLIDKTHRYTAVVGTEAVGVGVKTFKSRWGSCSAKGRIDYNWKIILAPNRMVDYVVVHELCHLVHHDHSPKFWREVERILPDYQECKAWLKTHSTSLDF